MHQMLRKSSYNAVLQKSETLVSVWETYQLELLVSLNCCHAAHVTVQLFTEEVPDP